MVRKTIGAFVLRDAKWEMFTIRVVSEGSINLGMMKCNPGGGIKVG